MISWYERKGFFSKIKDVYLKRFNIKKFWNNLKINKIDNDLKKLVDSYLRSDSLKFSSKYWDKLNMHTLDLINNLGIEKFHTSVANSYFTWKSINDEFIKGLFNFFDSNTFDKIDSNILLKKHDGFTITQSINYNLISILLYQYLIKNNQQPELKILEQNDFMIQNCPRLKINELTITEDKLHSLIEYNQIKKIIKDEKSKLNYLEIGAGSGRTTETIIRLDQRVNKYVIADIPPALYVNFLRIKHTFKNLKVKMCADIDSEKDFEKEIRENDIIFIFPHQLKNFKNNFFDISIAIDCLHEMEKKTIKKYMEIFNQKSKFLYFKVLEETYVPYDYNNYLNANNEKSYYIDSNWKQIFKEKCICPSNYMELAYETKS
tara:strand:+ start:8 stop:1135 length:1128 start_codon:yes stop_codon:yes gene_type:complete